MHPHTSESRGIRYLHFASPWVQGAMQLSKPDMPYLRYIQQMYGGLLWFADRSLPQLKAMQLGLGAAACTKFAYKVLGVHTVAVELSREVVRACQSWFGLDRAHPLLEIVENDAAQEIQAPRWHSQIDLLQVDLYDHEAASPVLDSEAFYADCHAVLTDAGCMSVNLFGRHHSYTHSLRKITDVFGVSCVWAFAPTPEGNTVVLAFKNIPMTDRTLLQRRAVDIEAKYKISAPRWLGALKPVSLPFNPTD